MSQAGSEAPGSSPCAATSEISAQPGAGRPVRAEIWPIVILTGWVGLVTAGFAAAMMYRAETLGYPIARILYEDQFYSVDDGHLIPRAGEVPAALATLLVAPMTWLQLMSYFPLTELFGGAHGVAIARINQFVLYQLGTLLTYRLLRHARADRWVAVVLAAAYAVSPVVLTRMMPCNSLPGAQFILWSELCRIQRRPTARAIGLLAASFCHPLVGFSALFLAAQDYWRGPPAEHRARRNILISVVVALAIVHVGVLVLWSRARPELRFGLHMVDLLTYPMFPYRLGRILAAPMRIFEIAVFVAGSCAFLLVNPIALAAAVVDLTYYAVTNSGVRDHSQVMTSIGLFTVLGVRARLFTGGDRRRNAILAAGALFATIWGHAFSGINGLTNVARLPAPPHPHVADVAACLRPGEKHCVVPRSLYAGFAGRCDFLATYEPADLAQLQIVDTQTTFYVAPSRLDCDPKNTECGPLGDRSVLSALAARIRKGELSATLCPPWFALIRSAQPGMPSDPAAADWIERPSP